MLCRLAVAAPSPCETRKSLSFATNTDSRISGISVKRRGFAPPFPCFSPGYPRLVAVLADSTSATSLEEVEVGAGIGPFDMLLMQEGIARCRQIMVRLPFGQTTRQFLFGNVEMQATRRPG